MMALMSYGQQSVGGSYVGERENVATVALTQRHSIGFFADSYLARVARIGRKSGMPCRNRRTHSFPPQILRLIYLHSVPFREFLRPAFRRESSH